MSATADGACQLGRPSPLPPSLQEKEDGSPLQAAHREAEAKTHWNKPKLIYFNVSWIGF